MEVENENGKTTTTDIPNVVAKTPKVKTNDSVLQTLDRSINLLDEKQLLAAENLLTKLVRSEKGGIKTVNDGIAMLLRAQDLNLPFSSCLEHIHVINGKTGIDVHLIKALLSKAGCFWECIKDYQPLYEYTDGINVYNDGNFPDYVKKVKSKIEAEELYKQNKNSDIVYVYPVKFYKDTTGNIYRDYQLNTQRFSIVVNKEDIQTAIANKKIPVFRVASVPIDYVTEYKITRNIKGKEVFSYGRFSYSEAVAAKMFDKDTYKYYARILIGHRAFTYAARDIASDILFGVMETTELKIVNNKTLTADDFETVETIY